MNKTLFCLIFSLLASAHAQIHSESTLVAKELASAASIGLGTYGLSTLWSERKASRPLRKKVAKLLASIGLISLGVYGLRNTATQQNTPSLGEHQNLTVYPSPASTEAVVQPLHSQGEEPSTLTREEITTEEEEKDDHEEKIPLREKTTIDPQTPAGRSALATMRPTQKKPLIPNRKKPSAIPFPPLLDSPVASNITDTPPSLLPQVAPAPLHKEAMSQEIEADLLEIPGLIEETAAQPTVTIKALTPTQCASVAPPALTAEKKPMGNYHAPSAQRITPRKGASATPPETEIPLHGSTPLASAPNTESPSAFALFTTKGATGTADFFTPGRARTIKPLLSTTGFKIEGFTEIFGKAPLNSFGNKKLLAYVLGSTQTPNAPEPQKKIEASALYSYEIYDENHENITDRLPEKQLESLFSSLTLVSEEDLFAITRTDRPHVYKISPKCGLPECAHEVAVWLDAILPGILQKQDAADIQAQAQYDRSMRGPRPYPAQKARRRLDFSAM